MAQIKTTGNLTNEETTVFTWNTDNEIVFVKVFNYTATDKSASVKHNETELQGTICGGFEGFPNFSQHEITMQAGDLLIVSGDSDISVQIIA
jgi:hypothetical protein